MATRAQKVKVGVFVTVSAVLLAGSLILVSGFTKENVVRYRCEFPHTVGGLAPGAAVRYSGVPVGKVKSVWVSPNQTVCVNIEVFKERITLYEGVRAGLDLAGIMGGPVIELAGGDPQKGELPSGSNIPVAPTSALHKLYMKFPILLSNIENIIDKINRALGDPYKGEVIDIIHKTNILLTDATAVLARLDKRLDTTLRHADENIDTVGKDVKKTLGKADELIVSGRATIEENRAALKSTIARADRLLAKLEKEMDPIDVKGLGDDMRETTRKLGTAAEKIDKAAEKTTVVLENAGEDLSALRYSLRQTLSDLDETLRAAKRLLEYLERDPGSLIHGKQAKGSR
jgi:phospholipid/cholesterol/gamma-HCH transport system substrate-binding protein